MTRPVPWEGGLPWHDPGFSERMLREHLDQSHGLASRPFVTVDTHIDWIHRVALGAQPSRVLDLGCGPGLYTERLAALGHRCSGIDFAPAPLEYARRASEQSGSDIEYRLEDVRTADLGTAFDLVTFLFGDADTIPPDDIAPLIARIAGALRPGGRLVLEVHTRDAVESAGTTPSGTADLDTGLFLDAPHRLEWESWWDPESATAMTRYRVVQSDGRIAEHLVTVQHRGLEGYLPHLTSAGFGATERHAGFGEAVDPNFELLVATRT